MDSMVQEKNSAKAELERAKRLIQKLAARTEDRGATEHEAMEAADKINELLMQFDLRLTDVIVREERCVQREVFAADEAMSSVIVGLGKLCSLVAYRKNETTPVTFVLFGMERDIELAIYLYEICHEAADDGWAKHIQSGRGHTVKQRESYRAGFGSRLFERFVDLKDERERHRAQHVTSTGTDLVLVREGIVEEEFAKTGVRLVANRRARRIADYRSYRHGARDADEVNLNSPLGGGRSPEMLR